MLSSTTGSHTLRFVRLVSAATCSLLSQRVDRLARPLDFLAIDLVGITSRPKGSMQLSAADRLNQLHGIEGADTSCRQDFDQVAAVVVK